MAFTSLRAFIMPRCMAHSTVGLRKPSAIVPSGRMTTISSPVMLSYGIPDGVRYIRPVFGSRTLMLPHVSTVRPECSIRLPQAIRCSL